jgi:hypothetical protein
MGVGGQRHAPAALPLGMTRYPLYRRLGRFQGRSGRVLKISLPPAFDPRTVQLVASRCTDYAIPAHINIRAKATFKNIAAFITLIGLEVLYVQNEILRLFGPISSAIVQPQNSSPDTRELIYGPFGTLTIRRLQCVYQLK